MSFLFLNQNIGFERSIDHQKHMFKLICKICHFWLSYQNMRFLYSWVGFRGASVSLGHFASFFICVCMHVCLYMQRTLTLAYFHLFQRHSVQHTFLINRKRFLISCLQKTADQGLHYKCFTSFLISQGAKHL